MSKKEPYKQLRAGSVEGWKKWLEKHHNTEKEVWVVFRKKSSGQVPYDMPMIRDEALCWGWVDSLLRSIDEVEYMVKYTPRKPTSTWSEINKKRVEQLTKEGRMTERGLMTVEVAKENGMWDKGINPPEVNDSLPGALLHALQANPAARDNYFAMPATKQKQYNIWINMAKRAETIRKRVEESVRLLEQGMELGLK